MTALLIDTPLTRAALIICAEATAGRFRDDGVTPEIEHGIAVANGAVELYRRQHLLCYSIALTPIMDRESELLTVSGLGHDVVEDVEGFTNATLVDPLVATGLINVPEGSLIDATLNWLNKHRHTSYLALILAAKSLWSSRFIKRGDLAINLPTAKPHNREKYLLAQHILTT